MMNNARGRWLVLDRRGWIIALIVLGALALAARTPVSAQDLAQPATPSTLDWIEPRGINVVDMVGLVPEARLQGTIVRFQSWYGVALYEAGERNGDVVTLTLRMETGANNSVFCPGRPGERDEWPSIAPAGTARIFAGTRDITEQAVYWEYTPAGLIKPTANTNNNDRYPVVKGAPTFTPEGALQIPANMGCVIILRSAFADVSVVFTLDAPQKIRLTPLGSQTMDFRTYIGVGNAGRLTALSDQMRSRYDDRHDEVDMQAPAGADFYLASFPTTPVNPYGDPNAPLSAGGGTYRIRRGNGKLSVDHTNTMGLPIFANFQDADQSPGAAYLPFFDDVRKWTAPEYFVPTGVAYDPCMTNGGCPESLLDTIHDVTMQATLYYYDVERVAGGLTQIPIKQVGPAWSPSRVRAAQQATIPGQDNVIYLPTIAYSQPPELLPVDDPTNCPCGWFDANGAMFAYVPGP